MYEIIINTPFEIDATDTLPDCPAAQTPGFSFLSDHVPSVVTVPSGKQTWLETFLLWTS
jgi:hypothetical protein